MNQPIIFSYKVYKEFPCPIIKFSLCAKEKWIDVEAYVDSGASVSLFSIIDAQRLKIDYKTGKQIYFTVGDGNLIPVYLHSLSAKIGDISFRSAIGFSPNLGVGFNLLGRKDFFTQFDITFSDADRTIIFTPHKR